MHSLAQQSCGTTTQGFRRCNPVARTPVPRPSCQAPSACRLRGCKVRAQAALSESAETAMLVEQQKCGLLASVAGINRGEIASISQRQAVLQAVATLEAVGRPSLPADAAAMQSALQGRWQLIYSTAEAFRSSPFFWAFQEGLVGGRDIARQIFRFTDSIPGAQVGVAYQAFEPSGQLVSEVDLEVFPGVRGCVVTTSSWAVLPDKPCEVEVTVQDTRVANSNLLPFVFESVAVPVQDIFERLRGPGATRVMAEVTYIDATLRVSHTLPDGEVFVYRKV